MGRDYSRRAALKATALGATTVLAAPAILRRRFRLLAHSTREYTKRCVDLVTGSLVVDMLAPLTINGETQERWGQDVAGFSSNDAAEFGGSEIDVFHIASGVGDDLSGVHRSGKAGILIGIQTRSTFAPSTT